MYLPYHNQFAVSIPRFKRFGKRRKGRETPAINCIDMIMIIQKVYEYLFILPCICIAFTINQGNNRQQSVYIVFQEAFHASILETISARDTKVGTLAKYKLLF